MSLVNKPGMSLLIVGIVMFVVVRPLGGKLPLIGGVISPMAFVLGLLGIIGGGYLIARSTFGTK